MKMMKQILTATLLATTVTMSVRAQETQPAHAPTAVAAVPVAVGPITNQPEFARNISASLVLVEVTLRNENGSREEAGQGILLNDQGVILVSGGLLPEIVPLDFIKDIKVRAPGGKFQSVPAKILGRSHDRLFIFLKADKPIAGTPLDLSRTAKPDLGTKLLAVGLMGKDAGYGTYVGEGSVKARLHMQHELVISNSFSLTRSNSPVFDLNTGALLGLTIPSQGENMQLRLGNQSQNVELSDSDQTGTLLPWSEITGMLKEIPTKPFESKRGWLGIDGVTGIEEAMRTLYTITQPAGVTVGSVVPDMAGEKAGLRSKDIILTINGKPFSDSTVPTLMVQHYNRATMQAKPGDKMVLGILRDGAKQDITVTLGAFPKIPSEMKHVYSPQVGLVIRDVVFADTYTRKLPADQKGVIIALVKNGSAASLGQTPLTVGMLITKVNDQEVNNQKEFLDLVAKEFKDGSPREMVFVVIQRDGATAVCRIDLSK